MTNFDGAHLAGLFTTHILSFLKASRGSEFTPLIVDKNTVGEVNMHRVVGASAQKRREILANLIQEPLTASAAHIFPGQVEGEGGKRLDAVVAHFLDKQEWLESGVSLEDGLSELGVYFQPKTRLKSFKVGQVELVFKAEQVLDADVPQLQEAFFTGAESHAEFSKIW